MADGIVLIVGVHRSILSLHSSWWRSLFSLMSSQDMTSYGRSHDDVTISLDEVLRLTDPRIQNHPNEYDGVTIVEAGFNVDGTTMASLLTRVYRPLCVPYLLPFNSPDQCLITNYLDSQRSHWTQKRRQHIQQSTYAPPLCLFVQDGLSSLRPHSSPFIYQAFN